MSLSKCIPAGLPASLRKALTEAADRWEKETGDRGTAEVAALKSHLRELEENRRAALLSAAIEEKLAGKVRTLEELEGKWVPSAKGVGADDINVQDAGNAHDTIAWNKAREFRDLGVDTPLAERRAVGEDVSREMAGIDTGNARAKDAAKGLRDALDYLRGEFNWYGGRIKFRGNFLFPQLWSDAGIIEAGGRDVWVERLASRYESGVMDPLTGPHGAALEGDELRGALRGIADDILAGRSTGTIGITPGAVRNRHLDARAISYRDVNARLEDAAFFKSPDIFETVANHFHVMSRDIGAMQVFGPNPRLAYANARERVRQRGASTRWLSTETRLSFLDDTVRQVMGENSRPASAGIARQGRNVRSVLASGLLPLSLVSQLSDIVPVSLAASLYRIPAMEAVANGLKQVAGAGLTTAELSRIGVVVDGISSHLANSGVLDSSGWSRWLSEKSMRFYGIKAWSEGMQQGLEATMLGRLADLSHLTLKEADEQLGGNLLKLGWTERAWRTLRENGIEEIGGSRFASVGALDAATLSPAARRDVTERLVYTARRFSSLGMTLPDAKTLALMNFGTQAGTLAGEAARSATQFKTFGTQFLINQLGVIQQLPSQSARVGYAMKLLAGTAALGMMSLQIKRLLKGQGLAEMDPSTEQGQRLMFSAILQGGGFGVVGDFFSSATQQSRFGHGLLTTLAGPAFGAAEDVAALTFGNVGQAARGEQANFASEAIKFGGKYAPFLNAPFLGIAFQRLGVDQARLWADPSGTRRGFMSMERRQRDEFASEYWWAPGELSTRLGR